MTSPITWSQFLWILVPCSIIMITWRCAPLFLLKGKEVPESIARALGYIPPATFAALVGNDLIKPHAFDAGLWPAALPFVATLIVALVALKTKSLAWSALSGVLAYGFLMLIPC